MSEMYSGSSEGFKNLTKGYIDYAKEVILKRSVPDLRDGLKPVHRRILYGLYKDKEYGDNKPFNKSTTLVGKVLKYHPHGDTSVYDAMCRMTDLNGSFSIPLLRAEGSMGKVSSSNTPAKSRYTGMLMLDRTMKMFFQDMEGCEFELGEGGDFYEPTALPTRFPYVLANPSMGMAVSVGTRIPSFNFWDVIDIVQKYVSGEDITSDLLLPDFPTGGIYVMNTSELAKVMQTGKGSIKIRAKVEIQGRDIIVTEVPYGKTKEKICELIMKDKPLGVSTVIDASDFDNPVRVIITCTSKAAVESVLLELYRRNILQTITRADMLTVMNDMPVIGGVYNVIEKWVNWRKQVLTIKFEKELEGLREQLKPLSIFLQLLGDKGKLDKFIDLIVNHSTREAEDFLTNEYGNVEASKWICERRVSAFNKSEARYQKQYQSIADTIAAYEGYLKNLDKYIFDDLERLKLECKGSYNRKTEVSYTDYKFSRIRAENMEDGMEPVEALYTLRGDGWLSKIESFNDGIVSLLLEDDDVKIITKGLSNNTVIMVDNYGRILKVFGRELEANDWNEKGVYIPVKYNGEVAEDYQVLDMCLNDGTQKMFLYADGYASFLDTDEFIDNKSKNHIIQRGVPAYVHENLVDIIDITNAQDKYIFLMDRTGTRVRYGIQKISDIKRSGRSTRSKILGGTNLNIEYFAILDEQEMMALFDNAEMFIGKMRYAPKTNKLVGDKSEIQRGRFITDDDFNLEAWKEIVEENELQDVTLVGSENIMLFREEVEKLKNGTED